MKVIKRDGSIVEYDANKIISAIEKANQDVEEKERIDKIDIKKIIRYIEKLDKKRMLVEDIQDIIELKLMEYEKFILAKKYIVYRYNRALVRKQNTTDQSILTLIKNKSNEVEQNPKTKEAHNVSSQRNLIAGEVSKDLTRRILLPEKINRAHDEAKIFFHDTNYFLQPIFNCSLIQIQDMLDNGTIINDKMIESPKNFLTACTVLTQILAMAESGQYGGESIDIKYLGKYVKKSRDKWKKLIIDEYKEKVDKKVLTEIVELQVKKEISAGIQTIQYQLNTLMNSNGKTPSVSLFLHLDEEYEYLDETTLIIEEILKQRILGMKNEYGEYISPTFPKLIYVLNENNNLTGGKMDNITLLALKCSKKRGTPNYLSAKKMKLHYGNVFCPMGKNLFLSPFKKNFDKLLLEGRFNQGIITLNLPQIALLSNGEENVFFEILKERLELCFDALMRKHYALLGTYANVSPIHWCYGAIARIDKNQKIDVLLKKDYSNLALGYVGIYETVEFLSFKEKKDKKILAIKILKKLNEEINKWQKETGLVFSLYATPDLEIRSYFLKNDLKEYGVIDKITDKNCYMEASFAPPNEYQNLIERLKAEEEFEKYCLGGFITYIKKEELDEELIKFIYQHNQYVGFEK